MEGAIEARRDATKAKFDANMKKMEELRAMLAQLEQEQFRLQGEYRALTSLLPTGEAPPPQSQS